MREMQDTTEPRPCVRRHPRQPQAGDPRRRVQLGTGCPHRGPAPTCQQRQRAYRAPAAGGPDGVGSNARYGRLRVLTVAVDRDATRPMR